MTCLGTFGADLSVYLFYSAMVFFFNFKSVIYRNILYIISNNTVNDKQEQNFN